jgi:hypothetical protein
MMRLTTILSLAVVTVSTAALAQVTQAPVEQKLGNNVVTANTTGGPPMNDIAPANTMDTPMGNTDEAAPILGDPTNASAGQR